MNEVLSKNNYRKLLIENDVTVINKKEEVTFVADNKEKEEVVDFFLRNHRVNVMKVGLKDYTFTSASAYIDNYNKNLVNLISDASMELGTSTNISLKIKAIKKFYNDRLYSLYKSNASKVRIVVGYNTSKYIVLFDKLLIEVLNNKLDLSFIYEYISSLTKGDKLEIKYKETYWFPLEPDRTRGYSNMPYITGLTKVVEFDNILLPYMERLVNEYNSELNKFNTLQFKLKEF